jgi:hypothetical protein
MRRPRSAARRPALQLVRLEDRTTPTISFTQPNGFTIPGGNARSGAIGDFNGDTKPDLAVGSIGAGVDILLNDGTAQFTQTSVVGMGAEIVLAADMDVDGKMDVVTADSFNNKVYFARGNGNGTFQTPVSRDMGSLPRGIVVAEITGDGKPDLVVTTSPAVFVVTNDATPSVILGGAAASYTAPDGLDGYGTAVGDFNGDGKPDIATGGRSTHTVHVFLNNGNGTYPAGVAYPTGGSFEATGVSLGDANNDGRPDVIASYYNDVHAGIFLGAANGTFAAPITLTLAGRGGPFVVDLDLDGKTDIAGSGFPESTMTFFPGLGGAAFGSGTTVGVPFPTGFTIGDLNGDGRPDLAIPADLSPSSDFSRPRAGRMKAAAGGASRPGT